jgi:hypothetical protein
MMVTRHSLTSGYNHHARPLPQAREQGFVMSVANDGESKIRVRIQSNLPSTQAVQLVIHTRQVLKLSEQKTLHQWQR